MLPVERLFFYEYPSLDTQIFLDSIVPQFKHSLSLTLHHFLPVSGNLIWPQDSYKPVLNYVEGDGVSLTIAESSSMDLFHDLCSNDFREATKCHPLLPNLSVSHERAAAIALQVTVFPNSGFCVGITSHHAVMDGRTSTLFMKSWANICKAGTVSSLLTPFYDRTVIEDQDEAEAIVLNAWLKQVGPDNKSLMLMELLVPPGSVRATFELSGDDIVKLRKYGSGHNSKNGPLRLSTFSIVAGYIWFCLAKCLEIRKGMKTFFGFSIDCRSRLKPAISSSYFGNCVVVHIAIAEAEDVLGEDGVVSAMASFINSSTERSSSTTYEIPIGIAWSNRFEVYSVDFGWGRPKKVEMTSIDRTGAISISDRKNGNGGVEIGLVLKIEKMKAFASAFAKGLEIL